MNPPHKSFSSKDGEANTCDCFEPMVHKGNICQRFFGFGIIQWNGMGTKSMIFRSRKMPLPYI